MPWRQNSLYPLTGSLYENRWTLRWGAALAAMILNLTPNSTSKWRDCSGRQICPILCQLLHEWMGKGCFGEMSLQTFLLPPLLRWCYRGLVVHTEEYIEFLKVLNDHRASIKVKNTLDPQQVNFLDTTGFFEPVDEQHKRILTWVYFKSTHTHALLHKTIYHPKHTFKGIVKSQIIRFYRIASREEDLQESIAVLFLSLRSRGYLNRFLRAIKKKTLLELGSPGTTSPGAGVLYLWLPLTLHHICLYSGPSFVTLRSFQPVWATSKIVGW